MTNTKKYDIVKQLYVFLRTSYKRLHSIPLYEKWKLGLKQNYNSFIK
jgi:hypothetical protein